MSAGVFSQLTLQGIGREMFETWYGGVLQSGLTSARRSPPVPYRDHEAAFATARSGDSGKVLMDWTD